MHQEITPWRAPRGRAARRNYMILCVMATAVLVAVFAATMMLYPA